MTLFLWKCAHLFFSFFFFLLLWLFNTLSLSQNLSHTPPFTPICCWTYRKSTSLMRTRSKIRIPVDDLILYPSSQWPSLSPSPSYAFTSFVVANNYSPPHSSTDYSSSSYQHNFTSYTYFSQNPDPLPTTHLSTTSTLLFFFPDRSPWTIPNPATTATAIVDVLLSLWSNYEQLFSKPYTCWTQYIINFTVYLSNLSF